MNRGKQSVTATENITVQLNRGNAVLVELTGTGFTGTVDFQSALNGSNFGNHPYVLPRVAAPSRSVAQISNPSTRTLYMVVPPVTHLRIAVAVSAGTLDVEWREILHVGSAFFGGAFMQDGTVSVPGLSFSSDQDSGFYRESANKWHLVAEGASQLEISTSGVVVHKAVTISQLTAETGAVLTARHADTATGLTTAAGLPSATTDFLLLAQKSANGGLRAQVMAENDAGVTSVLALASVGGQASATKSTAGSSLVEVYASQHDGANALADITANGNVFGVVARVAGADRTIMILDEDGDLHLDGSATITTFDDAPDHELARALRVALRGATDPMRLEYAALVARHVPALTQAGILSPDWSMLNMKRLGLFQLDAIWQIGSKVVEIERRLEAAGIA